MHNMRTSFFNCKRDPQKYPASRFPYYRQLYELYEGDNYVDQALLEPIESLEAELDQPRAMAEVQDEEEDIEIVDPPNEPPARRNQRIPRSDRMLQYMERAVISIESTSANFERLTDAIIAHLNKE